MGRLIESIVGWWTESPAFGVASESFGLPARPPAFSSWGCRPQHLRMG